MVHEVCEEEGGEQNLRDEREGKKKKDWGDTREHRVTRKGCQSCQFWVWSGEQPEGQGR